MTEQDFLELDGHIKADAHEGALAACDRILAIAPDDGDAIRAKLCCQVELGKYAEALSLLDSKAELGSNCGFERAYCLYQLNREQEALSVLQESGVSGPQQALLAAQIHYRLGSHSEAAELFTSAAEQGVASAELSTNITAALVSAGRPAEAMDVGKVPPSSQFELFYNRACAAIDLGELSAAKSLLQSALTSCRESLPTDEYTEEEIEVELGVLTAQAAYVDQQRGDLEAAASAYKSLHSFKTELEPVVAAVAANNSVALRGGTRDLFDSWKKCKGNLSESLARKLTPRQRRAFLSNAALLSMHMSKGSQCKEILSTLTSEFPNAAEPALIQAALAMRNKQPGGEQMLVAAAESCDDVRPALTLAQLQLQAKQPERAVKTLEQITSLRSTPAMVGTLVALYERLGEIDSAAAALEAGSGTCPAFAHAAAAFHARHGRWVDAAKYQQRLVESDPRDLEALARLVVAASHFDPDAANEHLARLEVAAAVGGGDDEAMLDAEQLEQASLPRAAKARLGAEGGKRLASEAHGGAERPPKKKRRSRKKTIWPKGFDADNPGPPPDPERWLPKRERSNYRPRKKDKRGGISRGPQGSTSGQARPDHRTTTNVRALSEEEKAKAKREEEAKARSEAAAAAAASRSAESSKGKAKGKAKAKGK